MIRSDRGVVLAFVLARLGFGYQLQSVASLGPELVAAYGIGLSGLGTLVGIYLLPGVFTAFPYGLAARRFGDRWVAFGGVALLMVGGLVAAASAGPVMLGCGRMISGAGAVAITVLQGKVVADRVAGPRFVSAMGLVLGAFPAGIALAQLSQPRLAHAFGMPVAFLVGGVISGGGLILLIATWRDVESGQVRRFTWPNRQECLLVFVAGLVWTCYNAGYFNFLAYMPIYLATHGHSAWESDVVLSAATWTTGPSVLLGGTVAAWCGQRQVFLFAATIGMIAVGGVYFADIPLLWAVLFGLFASLHASVILAMGTLSTRPENRAVGMAVFYTLYYAGGFVLPPVCGRIAELTGDPSGAFLCAGILSALSIPLYFLHGALASRPSASPQQS